jgi:hypothetical protein
MRVLELVRCRTMIRKVGSLPSDTLQLGRFGSEAPLLDRRCSSGVTINSDYKTTSTRRGRKWHGVSD